MQREHGAPGETGMTGVSSEFGFQRAKDFQAGTQPGFTYISLLVIIAIIGISLGATGKYWQSIVQRDKEEELLFRGDQYRKAIEKYYLALPGRPQLPQSIDDLLADNRTATGRRHLRQRYKDPMTGEDFVEIRDPLSKRITGVHSAGEREPMKKSGFAPEYKDFEGKTKYREWVFSFSILPTQPVAPGHPPAVRPH